MTAIVVVVWFMKGIVLAHVIQHLRIERWRFWKRIGIFTLVDACLLICIEWVFPDSYTFWCMLLSAIAYTVESHKWLVPRLHAWFWRRYDDRVLRGMEWEFKDEPPQE